MCQLDWVGAHRLVLMPNQFNLDVKNYLGKWTLIVGEVNTGKTTLTEFLFNRIRHQVSSSRLAVIDLAPVVPEEITARLGLSGIGGRLNLPEVEKVLYLTSHIDPPRLSTNTEDAALAVAGRNRTKIEKLLQIFSTSERDVLFVNDISLYLHAGSSKNLIRYFNRVDTLVANGYCGKKLGKGTLSQREHQEMRALMASFSHVIQT